MYMKLKKTVLKTSVFLLSAVLLNGATADSDTSESSIIEALKKSLNDNSTGPILDSLQYPITMCVKNRISRFRSADELRSYSLEELLGGSEVIPILKDYLNNQAGAEAAEVSYGNRQVFNITQQKTDAQYVSINFTGDGIYRIEHAGCNGSKFPKLKFCGDREKDAKINMMAHNSTVFFNRGTYENFSDTGYSKIVMTPLEDTAGGAVDFTLNGKKLNLTRDPLSFDEAPVYTDGTREYMILSPGEFNEIYCFYPGRCRPVPFIHVFSRAKGSDTCDAEELVLAEKFTLNFCPFDRNMSSEIRLYTEGFSFNPEQVASGMDSYAGTDGSTSLRFESRTIKIEIPDEEGGGTYDKKAAMAVLTYGGSTYETEITENPLIYFTADDREIVAVAEGDYDKSNVIFDNLSCSEENSCIPPDERMVLFIRDSEGKCERMPLEKADKKVK